MNLDLPLIWAGIIALAVLLYVLLDGFDLGVGILFPFAGSPRRRDVMVDTVAPFWDGNETWLVLGGGGLMAAFPVAYAILMPALYAPVLLMLMGLILRGVAFEFRHRGRSRGKRFWTVVFTIASVVATFAQGLVLGGFVQGVEASGDVFTGAPFAWLTPYSFLVAAGLVAGYALLGATWIVWRTEGELQARARRWSWASAAATGVLLAAVSLATLAIRAPVAERWGFTEAGFELGRFLRLAVIPLLGVAGLALVAWGLRRRGHVAPFLGAYVVFLSGFAGLAAGFFPDVVPYGVTIWQAASPDNALAFLLVGAAILVPLIVGYTIWVHWIFRGKVGMDAGYY
jgi:cytochrome d ubiquinol oxidase subunit II